MKAVNDDDNLYYNNDDITFQENTLYSFNETDAIHPDLAKNRTSFNTSNNTTVYDERHHYCKDNLKAKSIIRYVYERCHVIQFGSDNLQVHFKCQKEPKIKDLMNKLCEVLNRPFEEIYVFYDLFRIDRCVERTFCELNIPNNSILHVHVDYPQQKMIN
ncbi:hypothetical protein GJ496_007240 [Pomphorhynchus laevis]|nr:hypothetical protein GJ496_007240 [Pomphorhynchus laevis]